MEEIPPLRVRIEVDTSGLRKVEADASRMANKVSTSTDQATKNVQRSMGGIGKAAQLAAGVITTAFAVDAIKTFAEVQDSISALEATYGDSAEAFKRFASEQAIAYNLSQREALGAQQTFANFARAAGLSGKELETFAIDLTQRAADMASYFGGSTTEAIEAMGAALRGETEPIRRYGVMLDDMSLRAQAVKMGISSSTKDALLPQQKVLAANALIMERTAQVQGDVARTQDSMANQIKNATAQYDNLKTSIGETLAVAAKPFLEFLNKSLNAFNKLPDGAKSTAIALGAIGAAALILVPRIMSVRTAFLQMQAAAVTSSRKSAVALGSAGKAATIAAIAMSASQAASAAMGRPLIDFGANLDDVENKAQRTANALYGVISPGAYKTLSNAAEGFMSVFVPVRTMLGAEKDAVAAYDLELAQLVSSGNSAEAARLFREQADAAAKYGATVDEVKAQFPQYAAALEDTGKAAEEAATGVDQFAKSALTADGVAQGLDDAAKNLKASLDALVGTQMGSEQATMRVEAAYDAARKAYKENSLTLDMSTGKGRDNRQALIDLATASVESAEAFARNGESLETIRGKMQSAREQFIQVATKMTGSSEKARELADTYGLIPDKVTTAIDQSGILTAIDNQREYNRQLQRSIDLRSMLGGAYASTTAFLNSSKADAVLGVITEPSRPTRSGRRGEATGGGRGDTNITVNAQGLTVDQVTREAIRRARLRAPIG